MNVNDILTTVSTKKANGHRNRHALARKNTQNMPINEEDQINHTLICTSGSRHDLMHNMYNITKKLRQIYPVIELSNDNLLDTPIASRPSTTASTDRYRFTTQVQVAYTGNNISRVSSRVGTLAGIGTGRVNPVLGDDQMVVSAPMDVNTSAYITSHNGSVLYLSLIHI